MPTALELSREEWQPYIDAARRRATLPELTPAEQQEREQLLARVRQAAVELKTRFGAKRVILFGSLAHRAWFTPTTDVDLAVEGVKDGYWEAWLAVENIIGDRPINLVELESAKPSMLRAIQRHGLEL